MKNKREDRFEAIVDQFVKNDLIDTRGVFLLLYGVKSFRSFNHDNRR